MATLTAPEQTKPKQQPPYAVIIMNDDIHSIQYVIETIKKVFGYPNEKAYKLAKNIEELGEETVWMGTLEVAELKRDQIISAGKDFYAKGEPVEIPLKVRLEPLT